MPSARARRNEIILYQIFFGGVHSRVSNKRTASNKRTLWKTWFRIACKKGQFDVVELMVNNQSKAFSIHLNAQHVNGMTPFDLAVYMYGY